MLVTLTGHKALITGGSKGLGLAMAKEFASSGADVAILARGKEDLESAENEIRGVAKGQVLALSCDVTNAVQIKSSYDQIIKIFGTVDILVNNAGASFAKPFEELTDEDFQNDFDLKLFSAIRLTRLVWPQMKAKKWGRVINVLAAGAKAPPANSSPSAITRAAGMAMTKVLSKEGAPHGILVNALLVGLIESDQWERKARASGVSTSEMLRRLGENVPLGRVGTAQEFANIACFLASEAGSYLTGTAINVDGGASPVV